MLGEISLVTLLVAGLAAGLGGLVQGVLGFGASYVLVPVLALWFPESLPAGVVIGVVPLNMVMVLQTRRATAWGAVARLTAGRVPGIGMGALVVAAVSPQAIAAVVGAILLLAVASSSMVPNPAITLRGQVVAGIVSGFTGTVAALAGPPIALLYRGTGGARLRATLPAVWVAGSLPTLTALWIVDRLQWEHLLVGLILAVCLVLGLYSGRPFADRIGGMDLRTPVLIWAGLGAALAVVRAVI